VRTNATMCVFVLALALSGAGLLMIYSASAPVAAAQINYVRGRGLERAATFRPINHDSFFLKRQLVWCGVGFAALLFFYTWDYNKNLKWSGWFWVATVVLLALVFVIGAKGGGARRWIRVGPFSLQPSEFAKLALVILTAKVLDDRREQLKSFARGFLLPLALAGVTITLIVVEDLGSAAVLGMIMVILWFIAGVRIRHMAMLVPVAVGFVAVAVAMKPYRLVRITTYLFGADSQDAGWHAMQSLIAVGTGGWTGRGLGEGLQKHRYVAAIHTDFIYADVCEELGFVGATVLLLIFAALIIAGFTIAYRTPDFVGAMLAAGATAMIAVPVVINVAVVLQLLPTKGLPLPFISYGGSSLMMNIAQRNEELQEVRRPVDAPFVSRLFGRGKASTAH